MGKNMKNIYYKSLIVAAVLSSFTQIAVADTIGPLAVDADAWTSGTVDKYTGTTFRIDSTNLGFVQFTVEGIPAGHIVDTASLTLTAKKIKVGDTLPDTFIASVPGVLLDGKVDLSSVTIGNQITSETDIVVGTPHDFDITTGISGNGTYTFMIDIADDKARNTKYHNNRADEAFRPKLTITTYKK